MTLAQITQFINDKIRNKIPKVVKIELADVTQVIAEQIFLTETSILETINVIEIIETQNLGIVFDKNLAILNGLNYRIKIKKIGKTVFLNGFVEKNSVESNTITLNVNNPEFEPVDNDISDLSVRNFINQSTNCYILGNNYNNGTNLPQIFMLNADGLPFVNGNYVRVFGFYTTKN